MDNTIIAREIIHSMRIRKGRKAWMAIKVDLEKAYDKPRWDFIKDTLLDVGFPLSLVRVIMDCITIVSTQITWNGRISSGFVPNRVIHQGCPLSLYIFVLCMERLGHLIHSKVTEKLWKSTVMGKNGPPVLHIFFLDDLFLFTEAETD